MNLSVVVSVYNGEKYLEKCLKSVTFAQEIVVVNNSSTDKTEEIARKYTQNIYKQKNDPSRIDIQKNLGFEKATGDWILYLDADEQVSPELAEEIKENIANCVNGYWIPRKNIIFGKWIEHTGWYPDLQLRLFKRGKGKFTEKHVHEMMRVEGELGRLENHITHDNYESISQFLGKLATIYGPNEAEQLIKKGYIFNWKDAIRFPVKEFLSRYFAREGYKDGFHGLMLSLLMGFYHFIVFSYLWEKHKFTQINDREMLAETEEEIAQSYKDLFFWFSQEKLKLIKNPVSKIYHKILRKVQS
jgi:glycosyltransferase involved in cell wall biosynthesis